ncbi:MAG: ABC transporter ATP-binding protein [Candidatus Micrarchaeota archaeon]
MIKAEHISKKFGDFEAVNDVSFSISNQEIFGIVGPNGAGKSTIVRILSTILSPTSGTASVMGMDIIDKPEEIRKIIGYLPEEPRTYDYMTGREYLELFSQLYETEDHVDSLLEFMDIVKHADRKIGEYSKGLRQRLSVARALVNDPKVLILDEPTMGLDPASARDLREKVLEMRDEGRTIIMCTHYMDEADFLCDKLIVLNNGRIASQGKPEALKAGLGKALFLRVVLEEDNGAFSKLTKARRKGRSLLVPVKSIHEGINKVSSTAKKTNAHILSIDTVSPTLEDVFVKVTRKVKG